MKTTIKLAEIDIQPILSSLDIGRVMAADIAQLINDALSDPDPSNTFMRLFYILQTLDQRDLALDMQAQALALRQIYRIAGCPQPEIRLLALMGPGDMMDNSPLEFVVENSGIRLDLLFISPDQPLPECIPDHDIAIVALSQSDKNEPLLARMEVLVATWPRPILNRPCHIMRCARDTMSQILSAVPGLYVPPTQRSRGQQQEARIFPLTIRPVDSHAGKNFARLESADALTAYLEANPAAAYFISPYVDYRSPDGLFRKYRIALIDGQPYLCHLAIADGWMVHYRSANMANDARKCAEEALTMANFERDFAVRHAPAFQAISSRLGLDYLILDCAEMADGRLLLFEADIAGWIHAIDEAEIFRYKAATMQKAFAAFKNMLARKSGLSHRQN